MFFMEKPRIVWFKEEQIMIKLILKKFDFLRLLDITGVRFARAI